MAVVASNTRLHVSCMRVTCTTWSLPHLVCQTSQELKELLEVAFTAQKEALVAHWGANADEAGKIDRYENIRETAVARTHPCRPFLFSFFSILVFVRTL